MGILQELNEKGMTICMVTHEADIAAFTKRNIVFRDGKMKSDVRVVQQSIAKDVLPNLKSIDDEDADDAGSGE